MNEVITDQYLSTLKPLGGVMFPKSVPKKKKDMMYYAKKQKEQAMKDYESMKYYKPIKKLTVRHLPAKKKRKTTKLLSTLKFAKVKLIPVPKLVKKADEVFSKWIRERDKYRCYANDISAEEIAKCKGCIQDCHLIERTCKLTRYDETNNNAGCSHHNFIHDKAPRPHPEIYTNWYIKKYGYEHYSQLVMKSTIYHKWTREELQEIIKKYEKDTKKT